MEKNEKKKISCSYALLVVVLFATVCFLVDYIVIDRKLNENKGGSSTNTNVSENTNDENVSDWLKTDDAISANKFTAYSQGILMNILRNFNDNVYSVKDVKNSFVPNGYSIKLDSRGDLYIRYHDETDERKIASNILSYHLIPVGQGGGNVLYYIHSGIGTVGKADVEYGYANGKEIEIEDEIKDLKRIVNILPGTFGDGISGTHGPIFVDIDGNMYLN